MSGFDHAGTSKHAPLNLDGATDTFRTISCKYRGMSAVHLEEVICVARANQEFVSRTDQIQVEFVSDPFFCGLQKRDYVGGLPFFIHWLLRLQKRPGCSTASGADLHFEGQDSKGELMGRLKGTHVAA